MKTCVRNPVGLSIVLVVGGLMLTGQARAQTFKTLYNFTAGNCDFCDIRLTNSDGVGPYETLVLSGNALYGSSSRGGSQGYGTIFKMETDGTGFTNLHIFSFTDGASPNGLLEVGNKLYGTTRSGTDSSWGTVFSLNTDGTGFALLHTFAGTDGFGPVAGLISLSNTLFGTTAQGGNSDNGTVFSLNIDGTGFTNLYSFTGPWFGYSNNVINADGAAPYGSLIISGTTLYGTAIAGGSSGNGTVFSLHTDGTGFRTLHSFAAFNGTNAFGEHVNTDGANPKGALTLSGNVLYGTTSFVGSNGLGTIFAAHTEGPGFRLLHAFTGGFTEGGSDGAEPQSGLLLSGNILYGTTADGGSYPGGGTVFSLNTDGTGFTILHRFPHDYGSNNDGSEPLAGLTLSENTLYGSATRGGSSDIGTIFSIALQPQLTITTIVTNWVLSWSTNFTGYTLQSTFTLHPSSIWTTNLPAPVVVNRQFTVTNPISSTQQFFRLSQ